MENDIFEKVFAELTKRRMAAISENDRRIREINKKIPELRAVNEALFNTGKELIAISNRLPKAAIEAKIKEIRINNLGAQDMSRQLLMNNGYPPDYLDIKFTCPVCNDTGYTKDGYCECFNRLYSAMAAEKFRKNSKIPLSSFDSFDLSYYKDEEVETMRKIFEYTKKYAAGFGEDSGNILMMGRTGLGKTHLSLSIANCVLNNSHSVVYDSIINILKNIQNEQFGRDYTTNTFDTITDVELLIIDDLGTEYESQFTNSAIYNIINTRINLQKSTIISTNYNFSDIKRRYEERIVSRLSSLYTVLEFVGDDIRLQKKKTAINI